MKIQLISTFPIQNLTLAIALEDKNSVFVAASVPWSQFMVPRREKGDQGFIGSSFCGYFLSPNYQINLKQEQLS